MTFDEKRRLAVQRELELMRESVRRFDQVVADAQAQAREFRESVTRLESIQTGEDNLDQAIDDLDKLFGRGIYDKALENANPGFRGTMAALDNVVSILDKSK